MLEKNHQKALETIGLIPGSASIDDELYTQRILNNIQIDRKKTAENCNKNKNAHCSMGLKLYFRYLSPISQYFDFFNLHHRFRSCRKRQIFFVRELRRSANERESARKNLQHVSVARWTLFKKLDASECIREIRIQKLFHFISCPFPSFFKRARDNPPCSLYGHPTTFSSCAR